MSQWGLTVEQAVSLTERQIEQLQLAYLERKKFEAKILINAFVKSMKPKEEDDGMMSLSSLAAMGFGIRGA